MRDLQRSFGVPAFSGGQRQISIGLWPLSFMGLNRKWKRGEIGNLAQFWPGPIDWKASESGVCGVVFINMMQTVFLTFCRVYFSDSVMCISLIEIGNLAEFWLRLQYIGRRVSQVSVECALLNTSAPTFPYFVFHILLAFRYLCVFLIDICSFLCLCLFWWDMVCSKYGCGDNCKYLFSLSPNLQITPTFRS